MIFTELVCHWLPMFPWMPKSTLRLMQLWELPEHLASSHLRRTRERHLIGFLRSVEQLLIFVEMVLNCLTLDMLFSILKSA